MGTHPMTDKYADRDVREEIDVTMPESGFVYYDTVLDTVATIHEVSKEYITYVIEQEIDNIHSDPREKFLAWLAAERFVKLGERDQENSLIVAEEELDEVFGQIYGLSLKSQQPKDIAATIIEKEIDERIDLII